MAGISNSDMECMEDPEPRRDACTAGRLAEVTGLTTGAITGVVDRLEKAGYVRARARRERPPQGLHLGGGGKAVEIGKFYVPMRRRCSSCGAATPTMSCGCCCASPMTATSGVLEATEALKAVIDMPPEQRASSQDAAEVSSLILRRPRAIALGRRIHAHIVPSIIQKCRQWSVSMMKLSPTMPRNAENTAR